MSAADAKCNVIWITADQMRQQAVGFMGDPNVHTPNLDRLAAEGIVFTGAVAGTPLCCPFRGSMLTSRYPHQAVPGHEYPLPEGMPTIAEPFRGAGYHTAYFGKWHLDGFKEKGGRAAKHIIPKDRRGGFDTWIGYENNNSQWDCWVHGDRGKGDEHWRLPGYETDALTDLLLDYLDEQEDPFFATLQVQPPHNPYVAPEEWMANHTPGALTLRPNVPSHSDYELPARRQLAGYYAMIENLDWNIGRILAKLDEVGQADNTHILFFSDHGDMLGSHGQFLKTNPWEESLRIPFIMGGGRLSYDRRQGYHPVPINHVDIAPTTLGLCGIPIPEWMEGTDYSGYRLPGNTVADEPDSAFIQLCVPTGHGHSIDRPWRGVVTRDGWKYVVLEGQPWMLFNLSNDPFEEVNLAYNPLHGAKRAELQECLRGWLEKTGDSFRLPHIS